MYLIKFKTKQNYTSCNETYSLFTFQFLLLFLISKYIIDKIIKQLFMFMKIEKKTKQNKNKKKKPIVKFIY